MDYKDLLQENKNLKILLCGAIKTHNGILLIRNSDIKGTIGDEKIHRYNNPVQERIELSIDDIQKR